MTIQQTSRFKRYILPYILLLTILFCLFFYSLTLGAVKSSFSQITSCFSQDQSATICHIIVVTRLPRTIAAVMAGSSFALAGAILFYITQNPLACPSLLGINQGAILGILLCLIIIPFMSIPGVIAAAIIGGIISGIIVYSIVSLIGVSNLKLVLVGQAINILLYALGQILIVLFPDKTGGMLVTLNGSLAGTSWQKIEIIAPFIIVITLTSILLAKKIYLLSLGKEIALSIGINANQLLIIIFCLIVGLCSLAVTMVGQLLFFPLIAVHLSKTLLRGRNPYHFCIITCLVGAILMLASDCLMRYIYTIQEIPLGIFIAIIGAPILILSSRLKRAQS
jgi:iron complex transport system permease protein